MHDSIERLIQWGATHKAGASLSQEECTQLLTMLHRSDSVQPVLSNRCQHCKKVIERNTGFNSWTCWPCYDAGKSPVPSQLPAQSDWPEKPVECLCDKGYYCVYHRAIDRIRQLEDALRGLRRGYCWCEMAVGNPMVTRHAPQCETARVLLERQS